MPLKRKFDPKIDPTSAWAEDVTEGRVVSGHLMRRACERHLRDITDGPARGIHWKPERAEPALAFFPAVLSVTAGAKVGEPFRLPSYTTFAVGSLFGWMRESGARRFRHAWLELGKGQIKSPLMAAIGIYVMGWCGVPRAEVYAIAKDRNQANVLFQDAVRMCDAAIPDSDGETLQSREDVIIRGTGEMSWLIEHPVSGSKFRALSGNEKVNGPRPSLVLADEIHEWKNPGPIETWQAALVKMPGDAMMILGTNTPAADQLVGTEYSEIYQRILRGESEDDSAFALIARTDPTDDPMQDETCWRKSLPVLDLTFPSENVRNEVKSAQHRIAKTLEVKRLYFGVPVGTSEYWIDLDAWEAVQGVVDDSAMVGEPCFLALDLSQKNDLTALGVGWMVEGKLHAKVRYWRPQGGMVDAAKRDGAQYVEWSQPQPDGRGPLLNAVPGKAIEYEFVAAEIQNWTARHDIKLMAFDPAHSIEFVKACERIGFETWIWKPDETGTGLKMVIHGQGATGMHSTKALWMPRSLQRLEDMILTGEIVVDESPITKWCAGNAAVRVDAQNNRFFVKKSQRGRIDGLTVLAMLAGATAAEVSERQPEYQLFFA